MNPLLATGLPMAGLLLAAVVIATRPWWRAAGTLRQDRRAANVAAYRLRLAEIESEIGSGLIPADEAAALRAELDARVLTDADGTEAEIVASGARQPLAVLLVTVLLGLFAGGWYLQRGGWDAQQKIAAGPPPAPAVDPQIVAMVDTLAGRLKANPADAEGWSMLGRAYMVMQRFPEAAEALAEANRRLPAPTADSLADEGEALAFAGGNEVAGDAAQRFEQALGLDAAHPKSLWYGGLASVAAGDYAAGRGRWQQLLGQPGLDPAMRTALQARLDALDKALAAQGVDAATAAGTASPAPPAAAGPPIVLTVAVSLAPELAAQVPPGAVLFVFAKAANGPPLPLAVQRLTSPTLPLTVTLDESMAMAPAMTLSKFDAYVITARLSASGTVQAQAGDLEGSIEATRANSGGAPLAVVIDRVRQQGLSAGPP